DAQPVRVRKRQRQLGVVVVLVVIFFVLVIFFVFVVVERRRGRPGRPLGFGLADRALLLDGRARHRRGGSDRRPHACRGGGRRRRLAQPGAGGRCDRVRGHRGAAGRLRVRREVVVREALASGGDERGPSVRVRR